MQQRVWVHFGPSNGFMFLDPRPTLCCFLDYLPKGFVLGLSPKWVWCLLGPISPMGFGAFLAPFHKDPVLSGPKIRNGYCGVDLCTIVQPLISYAINDITYSMIVCMSLLLSVCMCDCPYCQPVCFAAALPLCVLCVPMCGVAPKTRPVVALLIVHLLYAWRSLPNDTSNLCWHARLCYDHKHPTMVIWVSHIGVMRITHDTITIHLRMADKHHNPNR